jgi:biopolymer transport protein ExbD
MRRKHRIEDETEINITPMLDIIFIMLIFFIVTTSFVREEGLEISRPASTPPGEPDRDLGPIVVRIHADGSVSVKGRVLETGALQANLERENAELPGRPLVVAAHPEADTETLVHVLDAAKAVGIEAINVATTAQ